mgnify:CR=1 FL=1
MDPQEFSEYVKGGYVVIAEPKDNPNKGKTMWFNHKTPSRDRVKFTGYTKARVTMAPTQPTMADGITPDPNSAHQRLMEVEFMSDDPTLTAVGQLDTLLETFCKTELQKAVKGYKYNSEMHKRIAFNNRIRAKFTLTGNDAVDINRKLNESEITTAYVDEIAVDDIVDIELMFLGALLSNKVPSIMTRFTSVLILEKKKKEFAFGRYNLKRVAEAPVEGAEDAKRPAFEEVA